MQGVTVPIPVFWSVRCVPSRIVNEFATKTQLRQVDAGEEVEYHTSLAFIKGSVVKI